MNTNKKLKLVTISAIVIVVALLVTVITVNILQKRENSSDKQQAAYASAYQQANDFIVRNQYDDAIERLNTYLQTNPSKDHKRSVYAQMATIYANKEDYKTAIEWYQKAESIGGKKHLDTATGLAYAYQSLGNKDKAIEYFNLAIDLTKSSGDPMADSDVESYTNQIKQLEGQE